MRRSILLTLFAILLPATGCPDRASKPKPPQNAAAATALGAGQRANIRTTLEGIEKACIQFNAQKGTWPADMTELVDSGVWQDSERLDPWGNDYLIEVEGNKVTAITYGADGEPGGDDANTDFSSAAGR